MDGKTIGEMNFLVNGSNLEKFLYNLKSSSEDKFEFDLIYQKTENESELSKIIAQKFYNNNISEYNINKICKNCFKNVSTVENLTINTNLSLQIEQFAFENCSKLKTIIFDIKDEDLTIQSDAFKSCNELDCVHIKSASKITIEKDAFSQCYNLRVLILDSDNVEIRENAFESLNNLCIVCKNNNVVKEYCSKNNVEYKEL